MPAHQAAHPDTQKLPITISTGSEQVAAIVDARRRQGLALTRWD
ncbi:hypothetical protein ACWD00_33380 [Streptomyces viridiviolaceus]